MFLQRAVPAVETLSRQAKKVEAEANSLVLLFGESPEETKPESVFNTIAQFLADLRVRSAFVCLSMSLIMVRVTQRADAETHAIEAAAAAKSGQAAAGREGIRLRHSDNVPPPALASSDSKVRRRATWRVPLQTSSPSPSLFPGGTAGTKSRSLGAFSSRPWSARRSIARPAQWGYSPRPVCRGAPTLAHLPVLLMQRSLEADQEGLQNHDSFPGLLLRFVQLRNLVRAVDALLEEFPELDDLYNEALLECSGSDQRDEATKDSRRVPRGAARSCQICPNCFDSPGPR